ncbi:MAG: TPM domain-containing protein [Candidatus Bipolaricaulia bacterium]
MGTLRGWRWMAVVLVSLLSLGFATPILAQMDEIQIPERTGSINDLANLLNAPDRKMLGAKLGALRSEFGVELVILTVPGPVSDISALGDGIVRDWGLDQGRTVLLLYAEQGGEWFAHIQFSTDLEPLFRPERRAALRNTIESDLDAGQVRGSLTAGVDRLIAMIEADFGESTGATRNSFFGRIWSSITEVRLTRDRILYLLTGIAGLVLLTAAIVTYRDRGRRCPNCGARLEMRESTPYLMDKKHLIHHCSNCDYSRIETVEMKEG